MACRCHIVNSYYMELGIGFVLANSLPVSHCYSLIHGVRYWIYILDPLVTILCSHIIHF